MADRGAGGHPLTASADLFDWERQNAFARLSGDANPLHVDPAAARRLLFGRAVVHGVHGVLR
ncbi:MAG TPA: MaoC/PaaZ C-terminal domain-containing protein, partial [Elusimicrobiota bacterium]|nr:MaoC/PaaZ C-terminal domain-containing protein [Elusimicrobiota bacterium]